MNAFKIDSYWYLNSFITIKRAVELNICISFFLVVVAVIQFILSLAFNIFFCIQLHVYSFKLLNKKMKYMYTQSAHFIILMEGKKWMFYVVLQIRKI